MSSISLCCACAANDMFRAWGERSPNKVKTSQGCQSRSKRKANLYGIFIEQLLYIYMLRDGACVVRMM